MMDESSEYEKVLSAHGWDIHKFAYFGSYSGQWAAIVSKEGGIKKVIVSDYGSCSHCDAYQHKFDCVEEPSKQELCDFYEALCLEALDFEEALITTKWDRDDCAIRIWLKKQKNHFKKEEFHEETHRESDLSP